MGDVAAFALVAALIVVVAGPDMALVLRNGVVHGRRAAVTTALGVNAGLLVWALFVERGGSEIAQTFLVAGVFIAMGLVWLISYALLVAKVGDS